MKDPAPMELQQSEEDTTNENLVNIASNEDLPTVDMDKIIELNRHPMIGQFDENIDFDKYPNSPEVLEIFKDLDNDQDNLKPVESVKISKEKKSREQAEAEVDWSQYPIHPIVIEFMKDFDDDFENYDESVIVEPREKSEQETKSILLDEADNEEKFKEIMDDVYNPVESKPDLPNNEHLEVPSATVDKTEEALDDSDSGYSDLEDDIFEEFTNNYDNNEKAKSDKTSESFFSSLKNAVFNATSHLLKDSPIDLSGALNMIDKINRKAKKVFNEDINYEENVKKFADLASSAEQLLLEKVKDMEKLWESPEFQKHRRYVTVLRNSYKQIANFVAK